MNTNFDLSKKLNRSNQIVSHLHIKLKEFLLNNLLIKIP